MVLSSGRELFCLVLENESVEYGLGDFPRFGVELGEGLELQSSVVAGLPVFGIEEQRIRADGESDGRASDDVERRRKRRIPTRSSRRLIRFGPRRIRRRPRRCRLSRQRSRWSVGSMRW